MYHANSQCAFNINPTVNNITCYGMSNGIINLNPSGGIAPYTFQLNGGTSQTIGYFPGLGVGTYTVYVTDVTPCTDSIVVNLVQAPIISIPSVTATDVTCNGTCDGTMTITATGGLAPYNYQVVPFGASVGSNYFTNLCAGNYSVMATDANGCTATYNQNILQPPNLVSTITTTQASCNPGCDGTMIITSTGGLAPYSYQVFPSGTIVSSGYFTNLCAGIYTIVVTDANGCTSSYNQNILQPPNLVSTISSTTPASCNPGCDGTVTINTTGGFVGYTYSITPSTGAIISGNIIGGLCAGMNYTITSTDMMGCSATVFASVINSSPPPPLSIVTSGCNGNQTISCTNNGTSIGYFYSINPNNGTLISNGLFTGLINGTYTVSANDANGCFTSSVVTLSGSNSNLLVTQTISQTTCLGSSDGSILTVPLTGISPYTFYLNGINMGTSNTFVFANLAVGIDTIIVHDGVCSDTAIVNMTTSSSISLSLTGDTVLCGNHSDLVATASTNASWINNFELQPGSINNSTGIFPLTNSNTYTVTVSDANGCTISATHTTNVISNALTGVSAASVSYTESCSYASDGSIDVTTTPNTGLSYSWSSSDTTQDIVNKVAGNYQVMISNTNGDCLVLHDTINVLGTNCGTISGYDFIDSTSNCIFDVGDHYLANKQINLSTGATTFTDVNGYYYFGNVPFGNHTISKTPIANYSSNACPQPNAISINSSNPILSNINFMDSCNTLVDVGVFVYSTLMNPGFNEYYNIYLLNNSDSNAIGTLSFILNDSLTYINAYPTPLGVYPIASGDSIVWNFNMTPFSWSWSAGYYFYVNFNVPSNYSLNTSISSCAHVDVTNLPDSNLSNNDYCHTGILTNAMDPNIKSVNPPGLGTDGLVIFSQDHFDYTIQFQNTGTSAAQNIYILDTISDKLDINSFEVLAASHSYQIEILNGNILKFKFNNIQLPDSNTNEPASHGFISYRIKQKASNQIGDIILNTAAIYFDFNLPVFTNTTKNTLAIPEGINTISTFDNIQIYPNPTQDIISISLQSKMKSNYTFDVLNTLGQVLKSHSIKNKIGLIETHFSLSRFAKGIYFIRIANGNSFVMRKVMVE